MSFPPGRLCRLACWLADRLIVDLPSVSFVVTDDGVWDVPPRRDPSAVHVEDPDADRAERG